MTGDDPERKSGPLLIDTETDARLLAALERDRARGSGPELVTMGTDYEAAELRVLADYVGGLPADRVVLVSGRVPNTDLRALVAAVKDRGGEPIVLRLADEEPPPPIPPHLVADSLSALAETVHYPGPREKFSRNLEKRLASSSHSRRRRRRKGK